MENLVRNDLILRLYTPTKNGYSYQVVINFDMKMISRGYFLFNPIFSDSVKMNTRKQLNDICTILLWEGFTEEGK